MHKYAIALGIGIAVEIVVIAAAFLGESFGISLVYMLIGLLHAPGRLFFEFTRLPTDSIYFLIALFLSGVFQYFLIAMACISTFHLIRNLFKQPSAKNHVTLRESLLWIIPPLLIVLIIIPSIRNELLRTQALRYGNQARIIYLEIYGSSMDRTWYPHELLPRKGQHATSTDYFNDLVDHIFISTVDLAPKRTYAECCPEPPHYCFCQNVWMVTESDERERRWVARDLMDAPFLISRNVGFGDPPGPHQEGMTTAHMSGLIADDPLLKGKVGVVITYGGSLRLIPKSDARQETLNPSGHALPVLPP